MLYNTGKPKGWVLGKKIFYYLTKTLRGFENFGGLTVIATTKEEAICSNSINLFFL